MILKSFMIHFKEKKKNYTINKCCLCLRCLSNCKVRALKKGKANKIAIKERYNYYKINEMNQNSTLSAYNDYFNKIENNKADVGICDIRRTIFNRNGCRITLI